MCRGVLFHAGQRCSQEFPTGKGNAYSHGEFFEFPQIRFLLPYQSRGGQDRSPRLLVFFGCARLAAGEQPHGPKILAIL
jgi:hypothetical protein